MSEPNLASKENQEDSMVSSELKPLLDLRRWIVEDCLDFYRKQSELSSKSENYEIAIRFKHFALATEIILDRIDDEINTEQI